MPPFSSMNVLMRDFEGDDRGAAVFSTVLKK